MLLIFLALGIAILAIGIFGYANNWNENVYITLNLISGIILIITTIAIISVCSGYSERFVIDEKIEMYRQENSRIEEQMAVVVNEYMGYESETLKDFKNESTITLISLYPELKSNELVAKRLETYQNNYEKIVKLESKRLDMKIYAWWLFFGK